MTTTRKKPGRTTPKKEAEDNGAEAELSGLMEWLHSRKPVSRSCTLHRDAEVIDELRRAQTAHGLAKTLLTAKPDDENRVEEERRARKALEAAEAAADSSGMTFTFIGIGAAEMDALERAHPPTAAQVREHHEYARLIRQPAEPLGLNMETFPPALLARTCTEPGLSLEEAQELCEGTHLNQGERALLINTARAAQQAIGATE